MVKHRVLFISAPIGAGHIRAAQAVSQMLKVNYSCHTELCNIFDFFHPAIGQTILKTYLKILDIFPQAYGTMYGWGNQNNLALFGRELVSQVLAGRMLDYINKIQPSVIVCTHATPAGMVAWLKKKCLVTVPTAAIITDFVVHRLWVYPEFDHYFVAHSAMAEYLSQHGVESTSVAITGIPVSDSFIQPSDKDQVLDKLGLTRDRKTILIMGGGAGVLPMDEILKLCAQIDRPVQLIAVAGKNQQLYRKLVLLESVIGHPVKVLSYVDNVHELMSIADLLISKPGGMSASEALAMGVPLVIYRPIPGQEEANTRYLLGSSAAVRADSLSELKSILVNLLFEGNNDFISLRQQAALLGRPTAAKDIADIIAKKLIFC
ncbi:MGDG synthase family glycosyltransferase [Sporomusa malonica]|uniref:Processive 1,2-diacylglycerol beta-glucosyltransferase n=1 Tax=Sporomusa malonica TaxID=112901 RepID=A0A1W2B2E4_9FIRM|nr:glycosyltransferase [Sporomusa malonica]SMC66950.1 processive 1,2-diacylglycerol beta-glucosyltransferase [Sporomusa malonica]